jgi:hypothetical protein
MQLARIGPLTQLVKRTLTITNPNSMAVAFKVKTTAPKVSGAYLRYPRTEQMVWLAILRTSELREN